MVEPLILYGSFGIVFGTHAFIQYEKYSKNNRIKIEKANELINKMKINNINMLLAFEKTKKMLMKCVIFLMKCLKYLIMNIEK